MKHNFLRYDHAHMVEEKEACVARLQRLFHQATGFQAGPEFQVGGVPLCFMGCSYSQNH